MLFELEPSRRLTGGAFYNEELEIDTDFIEVLCKQCYLCVYEKVSDMEEKKMSKGESGIEDDFNSVRTLHQYLSIIYTICIHGRRVGKRSSMFFFC